MPHGCKTLHILAGANNLLLNSTGEGSDFPSLKSESLDRIDTFRIFSDSVASYRKSFEDNLYLIIFIISDVDRGTLPLNYICFCSS